MTENKGQVFEYRTVLDRVVDASKTAAGFQKVEEKGDGIHFTLFDSGEGEVTFAVRPDVLTLTYKGETVPTYTYHSEKGLTNWIVFALYECFVSDLSD